MEAAADQLSAAAWSRTRGRSENHLPRVAQETGTAITQTLLLQASGSSDFTAKALNHPTPTAVCVHVVCVCVCVCVQGWGQGGEGKTVGDKGKEREKERKRENGLQLAVPTNYQSNSFTSKLILESCSHTN